jgi:hypothetical protein
MAKVDSRVADIARQRDDRSALANTRQRAIDNRTAAAQSLAAFSGWLFAKQTPRSIQCFKTGAITNCTTN